jgi:hypothetical protein
MITDYAAAKFWFDVAQVLIWAALAVYLYYDRRDKATRGAVAAISRQSETGIADLGRLVNARLDGHEARLITVEACVEHVPKHGDLAAIYERINTIGGKVDEMSGELRGFRRGIDLIQQHLMGEG